MAVCNHPSSPWPVQPSLQRYRTTSQPANCHKARYMMVRCSISLVEEHTLLSATDDQSVECSKPSLRRRRTLRTFDLDLLHTHV